MSIVNDFIKTMLQNQYIILAVIIITALIVNAFIKGKKGIYETALYLVTVAEEEWGSKTGQIKFAQVISTIRMQYPIISIFLREETIKKIIEDALKEMKLIFQKKENLEFTEAAEPLKPFLETADPTTTEPEQIKTE